MKPSTLLHCAVSVPAIRPFVKLCLLPFAMVSLCGAEEPQPPVVDPGQPGGAPSDAIVLFDGKDLSKFRGQRQAEPTWKIADGAVESTPPGGIFSKEEFADCQLHVEWATPAEAKGEGQGRGNSGGYLLGCYEIQVLDRSPNQTNPNGQCATRQRVP